jgi:hypothetical protein
LLAMSTSVFVHSLIDKGGHEHLGYHDIWKSLGYLFFP